jgi:hypothetical protein
LSVLLCGEDRQYGEELRNGLKTEKRKKKKKEKKKKNSFFGCPSKTPTHTPLPSFF